MRESSRDRIRAARRQALMRRCLACEEKEHYSEAIHGYRQLMEEYPGTPEEAEAHERLLALAKVLADQGHIYRARDVRGLLG